MAGLHRRDSSSLGAENISLDGALWTVSYDDVRAAIAAARAGDVKHRSARTYDVWGRNRNHMQIFFTENIPGYVASADVQSVDGKWRYMGTARQTTTA